MHSFVINNTIFTGKFLIYESQMLSTNIFARNLLAKTKPIDGSVIITDEQTQGKGQGQNQWLTESHQNLTFSIIYDTSFLKAKNQFYLSAAIALGIRNALYHQIEDTSLCIKWPNDIMINDKKLGGILIENSVLGNYLKYSIIGIGINVNQEVFDNLPFATSLYNQGFQNISREKLLEEICSQIESQFFKLKSGKYLEILKSYNEHLFKKHQSFKFKKDEEVMEGIVQGVNDFGQLLVQLNDEVKTFNFGEIKWLLSD
ncbi:MAG: biotin--[acetyl-CoA-carboxylase] ligase [Chitinophagales bacterium]